MRPGQRRPSLHCLTLAYLLWTTACTRILYARADSLATTGVSSVEWKKILENDQGKDACTIQQWMASDCPQGGGGGSSTRRASHRRDDLGFAATNCTCTQPYFNILCGCRLTNDEAIDSVFDTWTTQCQQNNFSINGNTTWTRELGVDIPTWAYVNINNGTFDFAEVRNAANPPDHWSIIQIITPIVVGLSVLIVAGILFITWRRYQLARAKSTNTISFFAFLRKLFTPRAPSIRHRDRNDTWEIDERREQVVNENENDNASLFVPSFVQSPVADPEVSHWSPTTGSHHSPGQGRFSFTPRHSNLRVEQRMFGNSTVKSIGDRVKRWIPWVKRPVTVTNVRPTTDYRIDGDRVSIRSKSRNNTSSTVSHALRGKYATISEDDEEEADAVGTGRTRINQRIGGARPVTAEDRAAVADSVLVIGEADFTLESGSTNHSQHTRPVPKASPFLGRTGVDNTQSPSVTVDFNVEPPSPTTESMQVQSPSSIPKSPGAPPLLPPPPQERPPLPPATTRSTPRRTPSPHLRISTQFDANPINLSNIQLSNIDDHNHSNAHVQVNGASEHLYATSRVPPSNLQETPPVQHQRDGSGSSGTNVLSYVALPAVAHPRAQHSPHYNAGFVVDHNISSDSRRQSGLGSRPLPQETGLVPKTPGLAHQGSDSSMGQYSILRAPTGASTDRQGISSADNTKRSSQQSEFDPYIASGIPRPNHLQPNRHPEAQHSHPYSYPHQQRPASSSTLPREPGDSVGQLQRGWSADDEIDRDSLLMDQHPMEVQDSMSGSRGVYIAAPRDVATIGTMPTHYRGISSESFVSAVSDYGLGGGFGGGPRTIESNTHSAGAIKLSPPSPTLTSLEADARNNAGFATFARRESISGSSGWDASTMAHDSPVEPPPPISGHGSNISPRSLADFGTILVPNRTLSPILSPRLGHRRLESDSFSLKTSRSREDILNPARNDPVRLFPASVRAAGYTTALAPDSGPTPIPTPSRTPQPPGNRSGNTSTSGTQSGHTPSSSTSSQNTVATAVTSSVERDGGRMIGGGTWGTESSGAQSIREPVQQLPELYPHGTSNVSSQYKRTP